MQKACALSFWEHDAMLEADFVVVGAGLVGLQTALSLHERIPDARIVVLERGALPHGASTRNAGFACFGSLTEILRDMRDMGRSAAVAVAAQRWEGLQKLRRRFDDRAIGYEACGGLELLNAGHLEALDHLDELNAMLRPVFGRDAFRHDAGQLRNYGFGEQIKAVVGLPLEGQLHSGKLMRALLDLSARKGIAVRTGTHVKSMSEDSGCVVLHTTQGPAYRAAAVALCTNGMTGELLPDCGIVPARGQILLTAPLAALPWRGTCHMEEGYYYFRNVGDRLLVGGGRHLDFATEATSEMHTTDAIQQALERLLREVIAPGRRVEIERRWSGIMGFSADRQPIVRRVTDRVILGFGCNGMGVALGADIGERTAHLLESAAA